MRLGLFIIRLLTLTMVASALAQESPQTRAQWAQRLNIPNEVRRTFRKLRLNERYDFSFHINPFYLRGDLDGDGRADIAILVKDQSTAKVGIAILRAPAHTVTVLGAGNAFGNGGDDFSRINVWRVHPKEKVHRGADGGPAPPTLRSEAIFVEAAESASALIYWDGRRFRWYQQGD